MVQDMSDEELKQARTKIVQEIMDLNRGIELLRPRRDKAERKQLQIRRDFVSGELEYIDAEFKRRGLKPENQ